MKKFSKENIISDLKKMNIEKGDILWVLIDILQVGYYNKDRQTTLDDWVSIFQEIVGLEGGILFPAYTNTFFRFYKKKYYFERNTKCTTGSLPNHIINNPSSIRSSHPTNSVIALGENLRSVVQLHNEESMSYSIIGELLKNDKFKFLMLGTLDTKNAPPSMHYVQEVLGYTKKTVYKNLFQVYYFKNKEKKLFTKKDFGGCSSGGFKLIPYLIFDKCIEFGMVGNAYSAVMPGIKSYRCVRRILESNIGLIKCENTNCLHCYGNFHYNGFFIIPFYFKYMLNFPSRLKKFLKFHVNE